MALMEGQERREAILNILEQAQTPISGTSLAKQLQVSRQVIVQDMALLRAANKKIIATTRGYLIDQKEQVYQTRFYVAHETTQIQEELNHMVDAGGKVLDVVVKHPVYNEISVDLVLENRKQVKEFIHKIENNQGNPLMNIANGIHAHTVQAKEKETLEIIQKELENMGILIDAKPIL